MSIFSSFNRNIFLATSSLLVASSLFLSVPAQAITPADPDNYYNLIKVPGISSGDSYSFIGRKSFDAPNGNTESGTKLVIWHTHGGENQQFVYNKDAGLNTITIKNKCLDAFGGLNTGASIGLWDCHGGENQSWDVIQYPKIELPPGTPDVAVVRPATFSIRPRNNHNYCIDAAGSMTAGAQLILWPCHGGSNQRWLIRNGMDNIPYSN